MRIDKTTTGVGCALALALTVMAVTGCSSTATTQQKTVAAVSASEASLVAAGRVVMACYSVPACDKVAPKAQIKKAYDAAYDAVTAAQATADAGGTPTATAEAAAASAVATLQGLVAQLPKTAS